jgi:alkylation response protein AidB-like acyl-CoA dehydrogenase
VQHVDAGSGDRALHTTAAVGAASDLRQAMLECHHTLGAIGYAEEHEAPQLFRRVHADLALLGGVRQAREELAAQLLDGSGHALPSDDLGVDAQAIAFRAEVRSWLQANWSDEDRKAHAEEHFNRDFSMRIGKQGWIGLSWPRVAGGQERTPNEQLAYLQEIEWAQAPGSFHTAAEHLVGPALIAYGSPEQKARYLPQIQRGEISISLGYSEPEAGSDLASLRTRAERDGDEWVINGQKIWTTGLDHSDYIWLAARTDPDAVPPHAGISIFIVPANTPGITRQRSVAFYGQPFHASFWDNVRVPAEALVGELNQGWKILTSALAAERLLMGGHVVRAEALLADLCEHLAETARTDAVARDLVGRLASEVLIARQFVLRTASLMQQGKVPLAEAAVCKVYTSELLERFTESAVTLLGAPALLDRHNADAPCNGQIELGLRTSIMQVIGAGTSEIQRTLIAIRGLGLPPEPRPASQKKSDKRTS